MKLSSIHDGFLKEDTNRESQFKNGMVGGDFCTQMNQLAPDDHSYVALRSEREGFEDIWFSRVVQLDHKRLHHVIERTIKRRDGVRTSKNEGSGRIQWSEVHQIFPFLTEAAAKAATVTATATAAAKTKVSVHLPQLVA